jgi:hypothetical protein
MKQASGGGRLRKENAQLKDDSSSLERQLLITELRLLLTSLVQKLVRIMLMVWMRLCLVLVHLLRSKD